jgi:hypothetical protein
MSCLHRSSLCATWPGVLPGPIGIDEAFGCMTTTSQPEMTWTGKASVRLSIEETTDMTTGMSCARIYRGNVRRVDSISSSNDLTAGVASTGVS